MHPAGTVALEVETIAPAVEAAAVTDAVTETLWDTLLFGSDANTVIVAVPDEVLVVWTVSVAEPDPPVIEVVSKLATIPEIEEEALRLTVPVKPFVAVTLMEYVPLAPAGIVWEVGLTVKENSELLPPLPVVEPTVRRGEITQPSFRISAIASKNANVRIGCSSFRRPVINIRR
jgi:hypothetical protein